MLYAEFSTESVMGLITAAGVAAGAIGLAAGKFLDARQKRRAAGMQADAVYDAGVIGDYKALCDMKDRQIAQQEGQLSKVMRQLMTQQEVIERAVQRESICEQNIERIYGHVRLLTMQLQQQNRMLREMGKTVDSVPRMPDLKAYNRAEAEYDARSTAATTAMLTQEASDSGLLPTQQPPTEPELPVLPRDPGDANPSR